MYLYTAVINTFSRKLALLFDTDETQCIIYYIIYLLTNTYYFIWVYLFIILINVKFIFKGYKINIINCLKFFVYR